ncbi:MAG: ABC transporter ATP-binding protein [Spirochaetes bacterium]|nr:ABC transporter ATP-binding protein [Spirochaetota bacterium]
MSIRNAFKVKNLNFGYSGEMLLKDLSFNISSGEITVIIGPNGVGKTTLLKLLGHVLTGGSGVMDFFNTPLHGIKRNEFAKQVGIMFSDINFIYNYSVMEFIKMARYPYINPFVGCTALDDEIALQSLELAEINDLKDKKIMEISSGELQLVLIAHLLTQDTPVLLLDEPFAHLDLKHQLLVRNVLIKINRIKKKTVVIVTHNVDRIEGLADHVVLLKKGTLFRQGRADKVLTRKCIMELYDIKKM